jgi:hypothetical protein
MGAHTNHPEDPCMVVPAGPDRVACYATKTAPVGANHNEKVSSGQKNSKDCSLFGPGTENRIKCEKN